MQLVRYGRDVQTIFDLFGSKENDMTFALGWVLSKSRVMLEHLLADLLPETWSDVTEAVIELQTGRGENGITDIEITIPGHLFLIIEAKKGPELPQPIQLLKYVRVLEQASEPQQHLVAITSVTDVSASCHLQCPSIVRSRLHHRSWRRIRSIAQDAAAAERSPENKRWLRAFSEYVEGLLEMEMKYSNRVWVVSVGGRADGWSISFRDIVEEKKKYFYPVRRQWPDPPPNYVGFRYNGKLQSIHHVKAVSTFTRPHTLFPEAPKNQVWGLHYCLELGPAIRPAHVVTNGPRIRMAIRVWCFLDTLLTCKTISDALTETKQRERSES